MAAHHFFDLPAHITVARMHPMLGQTYCRTIALHDIIVNMKFSLE
jgi:hypothetical protein